MDVVFMYLQLQIPIIVLYLHSSSFSQDETMMNAN